MSDFTVSQSAAETRGRFSLERDGRPVGEMTYSRAGDDLIIVDHTETDESIKGMGGGKVLFSAMVAWARETGTRVMATCPFALAMFQKDPSSRDVFAG
ncbi:MAG: GNAT family N-acetyltransferase [Sandaracinaceae bacterium]|nr:MAG: N-acetyltransferase [Sandaracinaceae bacterium]HBQ15507.1 GNAT family N-acetyltransferase [Myxococcales bacterium]